MFGLLIAAVAVLGPTPARPAPPALSIVYESALYSGGSEIAGPFDNFGARSFDFWRDNYGFGYIPAATEARNCLSPVLHFCIHLAELRFAIPKGELMPGSIWWIDRFYRFRLLSIRTTRFRGKDIRTYLIKADSVFEKGLVSMNSTIYAYNDDIGIIGYSKAITEDYAPQLNDAPMNQGEVYALRSSYGLGGRENCKIWRCGSDD
jgi:hypothetical protein